MWEKYNLRQDITVESLLVFFIDCNPADNFDVGVDDWVFMSVDFGGGSCSFFAGCSGHLLL